MNTKKNKKNDVNKNILHAAGFLLFSFGNAFAQNNSFDKKLQKIDQSAVISGIIYDRVLPLSDLSIFNMPADKPHNTADFRFFKQAMSELHKAENDLIFSYFDSS